MTSLDIYLTETPRIFLTSLKNRFLRKKYPGNAETICKEIIKDCWNGRFFQTSTGNFKQFWSRDFGLCTDSLIKLGYEKEVHQTLRYALNRFKKYKKITTTLTPYGKPYDFPTFAVDSLPWLIHSIKVSKFSYYEYKNFLNSETQKFFKLVINESTGLVNPEISFSSIKDFAQRKSSCYDNCLIARLAQDLDHLKLDNPFAKYDYPSLIKRHFWNGKYFYDDLTRQEYVTGDANLFPFILGIISDKEMLASALQQMNHAELDLPFPLKYANKRTGIKFVWQEWIMPNYESDSVWTNLGPLFIKLVKQIDPEKAKAYKEKYKEQIEKYGNYLEVFFANGKPYQSLYYYCDSGMLWAANYLTL